MTGEANGLKLCDQAQQFGSVSRCGRQRLSGRRACTAPGRHAGPRPGAGNTAGWPDAAQSGGRFFLGDNADLPMPVTSTLPAWRASRSTARSNSPSRRALAASSARASASRTWRADCSKVESISRHYPNTNHGPTGNAPAGGGRCYALARVSSIAVFESFWPGPRCGLSMNDGIGESVLQQIQNHCHCCGPMGRDRFRRLPPNRRPRRGPRASGDAGDGWRRRSGRPFRRSCRRSANVEPFFQRAGKGAGGPGETRESAVRRRTERQPGRPAVRDRSTSVRRRA